MRDGLEKILLQEMIKNSVRLKSGQEMILVESKNQVQGLGLEHLMTRENLFLGMETTLIRLKSIIIIQDWK